jgi:hypothetical protein
MERENAVKILQALADGIDPATGEAFPADSVYQRADTVRALYFAIHSMGNPVRAKASAPQDKEKGSPANAGRPWSQEEDLLLGQGFDAGKTIEMLAEEHKRSRWAVEARLVRLGKIAAADSNLRYPPRNSTAKAANEPAAWGAHR